MPTRRATRSFREHILLVADFPRLCLPSFFQIHLLCMSTFDIWDLILPATLSFCSLEDYCSWSLGFRITGGFGTISPSPVGKSARFLLVASLWFLPSPAQFPGHFILREVPGLLLYLRQMTSRLLAERLRAKWNTQPMEKFPCIQYTNFRIPPPKKKVDPVTYEPNHPTILFSLPFLWQDTGGCLLLLSENFTQWTDDMGCASLHNNGVLAESSRCETMKSLLEISGKKMTNSLGVFLGGVNGPMSNSWNVWNSWDDSRMVNRFCCYKEQQGEVQAGKQRMDLGCPESKKAHSKYKQNLEAFQFGKTYGQLKSCNTQWTNTFIGSGQGYHNSISTHHNWCIALLWFPVCVKATTNQPGISCILSQHFSQAACSNCHPPKNRESERDKEFSRSKMFGKEEITNNDCKERRHHGSYRDQKQNVCIFRFWPPKFDPGVPHKWTGPPWTNDLLPGDRWCLSHRTLYPMVNSMPKL